MVKKLSNQELNRLTVAEFKASEKQPVVIVLDNIRSLNNIGSIFRTADAFRVEKILLCGITGTPPHRDIQKTALGATESVHWEYIQSTREAILNLKSSNYEIIAVEQIDSSQMLQYFTPVKNGRYALIFGNEINGVSSDILNLVNTFIEIPQFGIKHSFNVSVSVGIILWHLFLKQV